KSHSTGGIRNPSSLAARSQISSTNTHVATTSTVLDSSRPLPLVIEPPILSFSSRRRAAYQKCVPYVGLYRLAADQGDGAAVSRGIQQPLFDPIERGRAPNDLRWSLDRRLPACAGTRFRSDVYLAV